MRRKRLQKGTKGGKTGKEKKGERLKKKEHLAASHNANSLQSIAAKGGIG